VNAARLRRTGAWLTVVGLASTSLGATLLVATGAASRAAEPTSSSSVVEAVEGDSSSTQAWSDPSLVGDRDTHDPDYVTFSHLEVTVSQTRNLSHQSVTVDWKGGRPTSAGQFSYDYLQIMQCWGDDASGPTPEQCQWGAPNPGLNNLVGERTAQRGLKRGEDPQQAYDAAHLVPPPLTNPNLKAYTVPFTPVGGSPVTDVADYFTSASTNEITAARTGTDGTGTANMEIQTSLEAPHLGCGEELPSGAPRSCWLVVVPRGETNANGTLAEDSPGGSIVGSPLSASAWSHRMVFPLQFAAIGSSCALGNAEQRLVGNELFSDAMTSWQSALCGTGTTYGYSQIGDDEARAQLTSTVTGASRLAVVNAPLDPAPNEPVRYAPVAQTALVIAYTIDRQYRLGSSLSERDGTALDDLVLNPRLVAKLLTQSYRADVPGGGSGKPLTDNPRSIVNDPEFIALNPELEQFVHTAGPDGLMVGLGTSDAYAQLWRWIIADPFARAFLQGEPDEYGMTINPVYADLDLTHDPDLDSFPKADLSTYQQDATVPAPGYGTLDLRPYTNDMADAAARTQKANAGAKIVWDVNKLPPGFTSSGAQLPGSRFSMALADLASAQRYGLRTARLVNAAGQALAADDETMQAAVDAMTPAEDGPAAVKATDAEARVRGAYPLTLVDYAAIPVCSASPDQRGDYATFLRYAGSTGQVPGESKGALPRGYLPLGSSQRADLTAVADLLDDASAVAKLCPTEATATPTPTPTATATPTPTASPTPTPSATATTPASAQDPGSDPAAAPVPTAPADPTPSAAPPMADPDTGQSTAGDPIRTGGTSVGSARLGLVGSTGLGAACAVAGPLLMRRARVQALREGEFETDFS